MKLFPTLWQRPIFLIFLTVFALFGVFCFARELHTWFNRWREAARGSGVLWQLSAGVPISILPGPPRLTMPQFTLNADNAAVMLGHDQHEHERWSDIAGNYYSSEFIRNFSYMAAPAPDAPTVYVQWQQQGPRLRGRIEARNLKPNFAYQLKLGGDFARDRQGFEYIGYAGRWRLPGRGTNYTDADYENFAAKDQVEAYLLFDFFVTDADGNAQRDFELDSSLHVLWNARQRQRGVAETDMVEFTVNASDARHYARPKPGSSSEVLWAEREYCRYSRLKTQTRLPAHTYHANLVLTEESFHSIDKDGGYWATVYTLPISFTIQ